jgi:hypothetical protein
MVGQATNGAAVPQRGAAVDLVEALPAGGAPMAARVLAGPHRGLVAVLARLRGLKGVELGVDVGSMRQRAPEDGCDPLAARLVVQGRSAHPSARPS